MSVPPVYIPPVFDMLGKEVTEGDRIAVAISNGHSSKMKIGRVINITKTKLTVVWETKSPYAWEKKPTAIDHGIKKFIQINELTA